MIRVGTVINNNDPKMMGRVQLRVPNVHDGVSDEDLPWALNENSSSGNGAVNVPRIGDQVYTTVDEDQPIYKGSVISAATLRSKLTENYPNRKGFVTESGVSGFVDVATGLCEIDNGNGAVFTIHPSGDLSVQGAANLRFEVGSSVTVEAGSAVTVTAGSPITLTAPDINLMGNVQISGSLSAQGGVTMAGNLSVQGNTTLLNTTINGITQVGD